MKHENKYGIELDLNKNKFYKLPPSKAQIFIKRLLASLVVTMFVLGTFQYAHYDKRVSIDYMRFYYARSFGFDFEIHMDGRSNGSKLAS